MYVIDIYNAKEDLLPDVYEDKEGKVVMFVSELEAKQYLRSIYREHYITAEPLVDDDLILMSVQ